MTKRKRKGRREEEFNEEISFNKNLRRKEEKKAEMKEGQNEKNYKRCKNCKKRAAYKSFRRRFTLDMLLSVEVVTTPIYIGCHHKKIHNLSNKLCPTGCVIFFKHLKNLLHHFFDLARFFTLTKQMFISCSQF